MSFLSPLALAAFALSLPLVLLYFLKVRRRERRVSSLMFWEAVQRDREASTFFQRLQRDPLLILQILALLALSLALAKPVATVMGEGSRKVVVVLDTSASMKARDVSPTRFDAARGEAVQLVRRLREGAEVMVLEAGVQPTVTAAMSRDRDRAVAAIRSARPHDLPTRLIEAVRTARALVGADPRAEIHVFTDGAFTLTRSPEIDDPRVHWVGVGRRSQNVGITNLSVRKGYAGSFDYQAFVSLVNYTAEAQTFDFSLEVDGRKLAEKSVTMEPSVRRSVVLPFSHNGGGAVTARLHLSDDLAADNTAWAVLPPPRKIAVTLVSPGNLFLEKVLKTDPQVALDVKTPDQYQGGMGEADVVVLDSVTPPEGGPGPLHLREHGAARRADRGARAGSSARTSWTGTGRIRSCATSSSPRSPSRTPCACGRWRPAGRWSRRWAARSSTRSRSRIARPSSWASTCSRPTSRCGWRSR